MEWTETRVEMAVLPTITDLLNNPDNNVVEREQKTYATAYARHSGRSKQSARRKTTVMRRGTYLDIAVANRLVIG